MVPRAAVVSRERIQINRVEKRTTRAVSRPSALPSDGHSHELAHTSVPHGTRRTLESQPGHKTSISLSDASVPSDSADEGTASSVSSLCAQHVELQHADADLSKEDAAARERAMWNRVDQLSGTYVTITDVVARVARI